MAWNSFASTDLAANDAVRTARVEWLRARQLLAMEIPVAWSQAEVTTTATSFTSIATITFYVPDYAGTYYLHMAPETKVSAGTGTWKLVIGGDSGGEETVTGTGYVIDEASIQIGASSVNAQITIAIHAKVDSGANTFYLRNLGWGTLWVEEGA